MQTRTPPHSIEAEQSVLGALLIGDKNQKAREACDLLTPEMFYNLSHREMFKHMLAMMPTTHEIDLVSLSDYIDGKGKLEEVGGFAYIAELTKLTPSASNILAYAEQVRTLHQKRELIAIGNKIIESVYASEEVEDIANAAKEELSNIDSASAYEPTELRELMPELIDSIDARCKEDESALPIKTGLHGLDNSAGGFDWEQLIVLAGRPSHGKTLTALYAALHIGRTHPVQVFSMEMGKLKIAERCLSLLSGVKPDKLKLGQLDDEDWVKASQAMKQITSKQVNILLDETPRLSINQIRARAKRSAQKHGKLGLLVIDYLGLMQLPKSDRHDLAIGEVTRSLKELAKEIKTPILLLAQANRELDKSERPTMSHIKDSSSIEADADLIFFAHKPGKDKPESAWGDRIVVYNAKDRDTNAKDSYLGATPCGMLGNVEQGEIIAIQQQESAPDYKPYRSKTNTDF